MRETKQRKLETFSLWTTELHGIFVWSDYNDILIKNINSHIVEVIMSGNSLVKVKAPKCPHLTPCPS